MCVRVCVCAYEVVGVVVGVWVSVGSVCRGCVGVWAFIEVYLCVRWWGCECMGVCECASVSVSGCGVMCGVGVRVGVGL